MRKWKNIPVYGLWGLTLSIMEILPKASCRFNTVHVREKLHFSKKEAEYSEVPCPQIAKAISPK